MILRTSFANQHLQLDHDRSEGFSPGGRGAAGKFLTNLNLGMFLLVVLILKQRGCFPYLILILIHFDQFNFFQYLVDGGRCRLPDVDAFSKGKMQRSP
jgi:hypothetical protein